MAAIVSWSSPILAVHSGGIPLVFYGVMMLVQFVFAFFFYPETKMNSLEQLQKNSIHD